ncbi:CDP-glycerol glycerophosphotransferase family protein [Nocardioides jensenii]|uniref:CDP-glycerol glycerophosphotransferase family protein n=1 Tax=Nocardioides jensenii TaxID=1843 RepID=UPI000836F625|nr:CDP-glycerol glycerophosphotransferase family protein [Nocardioides jensenii]
MLDRVRRAVRRRRTSVAVVVTVGPRQVRHLGEAMASLAAQDEAADEIVLCPWGGVRADDLQAIEGARVLATAETGNGARNSGTAATVSDTLLHLEATETLEHGALALLLGELTATEESVSGRGGTLGSRLWRRRSAPEFLDVHGRFGQSALESAARELAEVTTRNTDRTWATPFGTVPATADEIVAFSWMLSGLSSADVLVQVLRDESGAFLDDLEHASAADADAFGQAVATAWRALPRARHLDVPVETRVRLWLVAHGHREAMSRFTADRWFDEEQHPTRLVGERVFALLPVPGVDVPQDVLEIRPRLEVSLRRVRRDGHLVRLTVFAGCRWIDFSEHPPQFRARMAHARTGARVALTPESRPDRAATRFFRQAHQNHDAAGLEIAVDPAWLTIDGPWALEIGVTVGGVTLWGRATHRDPRGSAGVPDIGLTARAAFDTRHGFRIIRGEKAAPRPEPEPAPVVTSVELGETLVLHGMTSADFSLELRHGDWRVEAKVTTHGRDFTAVVPLRHRPWKLPPRPLPSGTWHFVWASAHASGDLPMPPKVASQTPRERITRSHRVRLLRGLRDQVLVELAAPLREDELGPWAQTRLRAAHAASRGPIDPDLVVFHSYAGSGTTDSPRAIFEELRRRRPDLRPVWGVADHSVPAPSGSRAVLIRSRAWYDALARAGTVVTNIEMNRFFRTRPGQRLVQTFHGYPSKAMGVGLWRDKNFSPLRIEQQLENTAHQWTVACVPSPEMELHYREQYGFDGTYLNQGYPRDDVLVGPEAAALRDQARERLGIGEGQNAILYAPTWRDDLATNYRAAPLHQHLDVARLADRLGPDHVVLLRGHRFHQPPGSGARVLDVSAYPEINDLILAADVAVLDYSSLRFDMALTGKPMVFLVPDLVDYSDEKRGFLFPFTNSAPGPLVETTDEVIELVRDVAALATEWAPAIDEFNATYNAWQDGRSAARAVDLLFP